MDNTGWAAIAAVILSYVFQWGRGVKVIPDPIVYALVGLLGLGLYWLALPATVHVTRDVIVTGVMWLFSIRGLAGTFSDVKAAPKANSL